MSGQGRSVSRALRGETAWTRDFARALGVTALTIFALSGLPGAASAGSAESGDPLQLASDDDLLQQDAGAGDDLLGGEGDSEAAQGDSLLGDGGGGGDAGSGDLLGGDGGSDGGLLSDDGGGGGESLPSDDLLGGGDGATEAGAEPDEDEGKSAFEMHKAAFENAGERYPSANECATCHPRQYRQWSVSQHAYGQMSPIYMAMQMAINSKTAATNGDFCIRCHNQVGMNLGESIYTSNLDRHPTSREGITCVVCHRVKKNYGKVSGRLPLVEGDLFSPVYGPKGGEELERVLDNPETYRVVTDREARGRGIHKEAKQFFQLTQPGFCGTCHDVTLLNGFRLEEAFAEYQQTEASENGVTCQDCHMGKEQGVPSGYARAPAAVVGGEPTKPRKVTNHYFAGPDYPIIHPGIFPHNVEAAQFKSLRDWLKFDYEAGWGTDAFEDGISLDHEFPDAWFAIDDRYDAREILEDQFDKLEWARQERQEVLRNGFRMGDIEVTEAGDGGLAFKVDVHNATNGHAVPTGFDAERLIFLHVTVRDGAGEVVYESGDRDPNGDVRDSHSLYVHNGDAPLDEDLFSLQTRFVIRMVRGGEREEVLSLNHSGTPQPFVRPETRATTIYGRPRGARKHKMTIPPLGKKTAEYALSSADLEGEGPYTINVKLIAQMVPVNLIAAIQGVGFDYGMSPKEIAERVVAGAHTLYDKTVTVRLDGEAVQEARGTE
jgi:hypothetical protein